MPMLVQMPRPLRRDFASVAVALLFIVSAVSVPGAMAASNEQAAPVALAPLTALQSNWAAADGNQFNQN